MPDLATIDNSKKQTIAVSVAPLWRRFAALVYDIFLLTAISFAYSAAWTAIGVISGNDAQQGDYQPMFQSPLFGLGWVLVMALFYFYFWKRFGQTLGMKTWRIQLVNSANPNQKMTSTQLALRIILGFFSLAVCGLGYFYRWTNKDRFCLHDQLSNTAVILLPKQKKSKP